MRIRVKKLRDTASVPEYAHASDAGVDLRAAEGGIVPAHGSRMVPTGLAFEIPQGYVGLQFPRSGLGSKGINLRNCVGVIDSGFRGELMMPVWNTTDKPFEFKVGDRLAQLVVMPYETIDYRESESLSDTDRGERGYGSTGVR